MRLLVCLLLLVLVGLLDAWSGAEISFSVFYLIPVVAAATLLSRRYGEVFSLASALTWGYQEAIGRTHSAGWIPVWNSGVRLAFFLIVVELVVATRAAHEQQRELARVDSLTGIANGRAFAEDAERVLARSRRTGSPFTFAYIDLDRFKQVNDELGHSEGDRLLRFVAEQIEGRVRETDAVARLGGDEFGVLLPDAGAEEARVSLERIVAAVDAGARDQWKVGMTIGAVTFDEPPPDVDCVVRIADMLMYEGKEAGRGQLRQLTWTRESVDCD